MNVISFISFISNEPPICYPGFERFDGCPGPRSTASLDAAAMACCRARKWQEAGLCLCNSQGIFKGSRDQKRSKKDKLGFSSLTPFTKTYSHIVLKPSVSQIKGHITSHKYPLQTQGFAIRGYPCWDWGYIQLPAYPLTKGFPENFP